MSYVLKITDTFTWTVRVQSKSVDISCTPLAHFPCTLRSVITVSEVIQSLDSSHFCIGNEDSKFFPLQEARKGVFLDGLRECITDNYNYVIVRINYVIKSHRK